MRSITRLWSTLQRHIRDQFGFSKAETKGVYTLIILLYSLFTIPPIIRLYYATFKKPVLEAGKQLPDSLCIDLHTKEQYAKNKNGQSQDPTESQKSMARQNQKKNKYHPTKHNINTTDSQTLEELPGIGPKRSTRIIKYRDQLGGFINKDQYKEVYGLDSLAMASLVKFTYISETFKPKQIDINHASFKALVRHPYLTYEEVKALLNWKNKHQSFKELGELLTYNLVDSSTFYKVLPYLTTSPK